MGGRRVRVRGGYRVCRVARRSEQRSRSLTLLSQRLNVRGGEGVGKGSEGGVEVWGRRVRGRFMKLMK
jgi:hypothetical protein